MKHFAYFCKSTNYNSNYYKMFLENTPGEKYRTGWIEVITGSMFSGKTEELIRRLKRTQLANQKVEIFKPVVDSRYSNHEVVSHDYNSILCTPVDTAANILLLVSDASVIGIDEAQFFDNGLIDVCNNLADRGKRVVVAGLDMDFKGNPFGPMPLMMSCAEYVTKLHAICMHCGNLAHYSFRKSGAENLIVIGEKEVYEPLCRDCYTLAINKNK
jgi:thymidine kinase